MPINHVLMTLYSQITSSNMFNESQHIVSTEHVQHLQNRGTGVDSRPCVSYVHAHKLTMSSVGKVSQWYALKLYSSWGVKVRSQKRSTSYMLQDKNVWWTSLIGVRQIFCSMKYLQSGFCALYWFFGSKYRCSKCKMFQQNYLLIRLVTSRTHNTSQWC